jgi:hypothetical protein
VGAQIDRFPERLDVAKRNWERFSARTRCEFPVTATEINTQRVVTQGTFVYLIAVRWMSKNRYVRNKIGGAPFIGVDVILAHKIYLTR